MTLHRLGFLAIVIAIVGYIGIHVGGLIVPPPLELTSPQNGLTTSSHLIELLGKTSAGAYVEVNGAPLPPTHEGVFRHTMVLRDGVNTIAVTARKRYSQTARIERQILILGSDNHISQKEGGGI